MELPRLPVRPRAHVFTVSDVLRDAQAGKLRVPRFQTGLRWGPPHVEELFDSIVRGFPIGGLLLWKRQAPAEDLVFGPVQIAASAISDAHYIVDGQQRVTALVAGLLHPDERPLGGTYAVWVDLATGTFKVWREHPPTASWIPLNLFGERTRLQHWARQARLGDQTDALVGRAFEIEESIIRYSLPAYVVQNATMEALKLIFSRTNSAGVRLEEQQVFQALFGDEQESKPLDVMAGWLDEQSGFGRLSSSWLLRCVKAVAGLDAGRGFTERAPPPPELMVISQEALRLSISFLQDEAGFVHQNVLPYRFPLIVLSRFFTLHHDLHPRNRALLTRWVWRGALSGSHTNSNHAAVRANLACLGEDQHESVQRLLSQVPTHSSIPDPLARWNGQAATTRIFATAMIALEPIDPSTEQPYARTDLSKILSRLDLGRVFRPALNGSEAIAARVFLPAGNRNLLRHAADDVLASYAITGDAANALREGDSARFVAARAITLRQHADRLVQLWAAPGENDRPPLATLLAGAR